MKARVIKEFRFEAAHQLPNHDGKCKGLHGHSYKVAVLVEGRINDTHGDPKEGMVIDFADIKAVWREAVEPLVDHQFLNHTLPVPTTTAENIAVWMLLTFRDAGIKVTAIEVWETQTSAAIVSWADAWNGHAKD